jgi:tetratricopeptide (TPR) repeat protein
MISNTQIDKKLDDFLTGVAGYDDLELFFTSNGVLNTNELVAEHRAAALAVQQYNVLQQVQFVHKKFVADQKVTEIKQPAKVVSMGATKMMMRIAAVLVIVLASVTTFQYLTSTGNSFYNKLNESYSINIVRGSQKPGELVEAYQSGNYKRTIELFTQISNPGNRELFIAANSYIQLNNTSRAVELYQQILNNNKSVAQKFYQDEAEYYLAMAYLKTGETEKALPILNKIADDKNHTYHDKIDKWTLWKMKWLGHK